MSKWSCGLNSFTPVAVADTVNFTALTYLALQNGASAVSMRTVISEVYLGGQATSSQPMYMVLAHDSTLGGTPVAPAAGVGWNDQIVPNAANMAAGYIPIAFNTASIQPQRATANTSARLNLSFNAFGGIARWTAMDPTEWYVLWDAGEVSLSAFTGSGASGTMGAHIVYEPQ